MTDKNIRDLAELPTGRKIRGYEIDFEPDKESWGEYHLGDGTKLRVKHTVIRVFRLVDENGDPAFDENGDPEVFVNGAIIVAASATNNKTSDTEDTK
jgi:hypothetical protein